MTQDFEERIRPRFDAADHRLRQLLNRVSGNPEAAAKGSGRA